jgi:hypothetical protein
MSSAAFSASHSASEDSALSAEGIDDSRRHNSISRHFAFLRADWIDAFIPKLELTGFVNADTYDGSGLLQISADYYLSDHWTVGGLIATHFGPARSDFGSLTEGANFMFKIARYF